MKLKSTNIYLRKLIADLSKQEAPIWKAVAKELTKKKTVNLAKINRYTNDKDMVVVPGKVLSNGELDHKLVIAAFKFSDSAFDKVRKAGSEAISILELVKRSPKGKSVKIIG